MLLLSLSRLPVSHTTFNTSRLVPTTRSPKSYHAEIGRSASDGREFASQSEGRANIPQFLRLYQILKRRIDFSEPEPLGQGQKAHDPLRDGPLRYLGYSNEVGEACAAWLFPGGVAVSYALAISYVLVDTRDKYTSAMKITRNKSVAIERGLDTLVWQMLASVCVPGWTIHQVVHATSAVLRLLLTQPAATTAVHGLASVSGLSSEVIASAVVKSVPTVVGLAIIPFIVHPIDLGVHAFLNATLRPAMRKYLVKKSLP